MTRKITEEEINRLKEYNKTHKYVSVEAYQDMLDWMPNEDDEAVKEIREEMEKDHILELAKEFRENERAIYQAALRKKLEEMAEFSYRDGCILFHHSFCNQEEAKKLSNGESGMLDTLARVLADVVMQTEQEMISDA